MIDFSTFVTALWVLYLIVHWIYMRFTYKYLAEKLIVLDTPPQNPSKNPHTIPLERGDWLKIFSHEYEQRFIIYYTRPLITNVDQMVKNIYPSMARHNVNMQSVFSSIELYRDDHKIWEMYIHEADGLVLKKGY